MRAYRIKDIPEENEAAGWRKRALAGGNSGGERSKMSSGGGSGRARPGDAEERRQKRAEQLARTSDEEFRAEVQAHQTAKWGPTGLVEHYPLHGRDVASVLGRPISEDEYVALTKEIQLR